MPALFVDQLTVIDFAYFDPKRGIVGESWIVDLILEGDLDDQGMIFDFGDVKKKIKMVIDASVDHKFVVPALNPKVKFEQHDNQLELTMQDSDNRYFKHLSPHEAVVLLDNQHVTQKAVTELLIKECFNVVPSNVKSIQLHLSSEKINGDFYHYAHGLKKHLGDCQRIAHGHRSQIHIFENGQRSRELESYWCQKWQDIYIATQEDLKEELTIDSISYYHFAYQSEQGDFSLTLPKDCCHMMQSDSTVELIAAHIATLIKAKRPQSEIRVKAFEGVNKGAIARL